MVLILKSNNPVCNFWNNCPYFAFLANVDKNYNLSKDLTFSIELALNLSTMKSDTLKTKQEVLSHMAFFFQNFHYDINMSIDLRLFDIILTYNSIRKNIKFRSNIYGNYRSKLRKKFIFLHLF